jgi:hypothetical protein
MTGQLRTTLQRHADDLEPLALDLGAVTRTGQRRVRRRSALIGGVAAGAVLATSLAVGTEALHRGSGDASFATAGSGGLLYAAGDVIHSGDVTVQADGLVYGVVPTSTGLVYVDRDLRVFAVDDSGSHRIGRLAEADFELVGDTAGSTVAWRGRDGLDVYRVSTDEVTTVPLVMPADGASIAQIRTVSDGTVWFWDARGNMTYDSLSGRLQHLDHLDAPAQVQDVEGDRMLAAAEGPDGATGVAVLHLPVTGPYQAQTTRALDGDLSPDGEHWFTTAADDHNDFEVFDSSSSRAQTPAYDGGHVTPYAWLDDDTIAAWTVSADDLYGPVTLLTCRVSSNTCSVAARDIGRFGRIAIDGQPVA